MQNEIDKEYRKVFFNQKRWAKHWTTPSAHRAHSSTCGMREPALKALEYIESIQKLKISDKERVMLLFNYYNENSNSFFDNKNNGLKLQIEKLEENGKAHIYRISY